MHHVLGAKLIIGSMVLSVESEFIENESEDVPKQDCKLNAFYRLTNRLKTTFKRLPVCILADSLYACEGVFKQCDQHNWKFLLRFKEGRIKSVMNEFQELKKIETDARIKDIYWVNQIAYNERKVNVLEGTLENKEGRKQYTFISNLMIAKKNAQHLVSTGRSRWKAKRGEKYIHNIQLLVRYIFQTQKKRNNLLFIADIIE
jgi:hypothetical protein